MEEEFKQGYMDGYDLNCPEPSGNRHPAYVHSFKIGRAEKLGLPTPSNAVSLRRVKLIEENCK